MGLSFSADECSQMIYMLHTAKPILGKHADVMPY